MVAKWENLMPWGALRSSASPNNRTEQLVPRPPLRSQVKPGLLQAGPGLAAELASECPLTLRAALSCATGLSQARTQQKDDLGILKEALHSTKSQIHHTTALGSISILQSTCPAQLRICLTFYHIYIGGDTFSLTGSC